MSIVDEVVNIDFTCKGRIQGHNCKVPSADHYICKDLWILENKFKKCKPLIDIDQD